jgi:hypothetical protein
LLGCAGSIRYPQQVTDSGGRTKRRLPARAIIN